jgi:hypothetical protein
MRLCPLFTALHLYLSDTEQTPPTRVRMRGLRHNSRHKIPGTFHGHPITRGRAPLAHSASARLCVCRVSVQPRLMGLSKRLVAG